MNQPFTIETIRPIRDGMTVSKDSQLSAVTPVTFFSLGQTPPSARRAMIA